MTNKEFAAKMADIATNCKTLYVWGCYGSPMTDSNKVRYFNKHTPNRREDRAARIMAASADTFGFDCSCLIKGVLWGWNGDKDEVDGGAVYASNGVPDLRADDMIEKCLNVTSDFSDIEAGEVVWFKGHIGVYIGNGLAVESSDSYGSRVLITAVGNLGEKAGYNSTTWTHHGKLPYVTYVEDATFEQQKEL